MSEMQGSIRLYHSIQSYHNQSMKHYNISVESWEKRKIDKLLQTSFALFSLHYLQNHSCTLCILSININQNFSVYKTISFLFPKVQVFYVLFEICQKLRILSGFQWLRVPARWILSQPGGGDQTVVILISQHQSLSSYCNIKWKNTYIYARFLEYICFARINGTAGHKD